MSPIRLRTLTDGALARIAGAWNAQDRARAAAVFRRWSDVLESPRPEHHPLPVQLELFPPEPKSQIPRLLDAGGRAVLALGIQAVSLAA